MRRLANSDESGSYAGGEDHPSEQVEDEQPDKKGYPGSPGWGLRHRSP